MFFEIAITLIYIFYFSKYLRTIIDDKLSWHLNTANVFSKCQQRLHFIRVLKSFGINNTILSLFYRSVVQSVLTFNIIVLWSNARILQQNNLKRITRRSLKLLRTNMDTSLPISTMDDYSLTKLLKRFYLYKWVPILILSSTIMRRWDLRYFALYKPGHNVIDSRLFQIHFMCSIIFHNM